MNAGVWIVLIIVAAILATPKPLRWTLKRLGPVLLLVICTFSLFLFFQRAERTTVTITAKGERNAEAEGGEIWLKSVIVDGKEYKAEEFFSDGWIQEEGYLKWRGYNRPAGFRDMITGQIPAGKAIKLVFDSNKWRGIASVDTKTEHLTIDTFDSGDKPKTKTIALELVGELSAFVVDGKSLIFGLLGGLTALAVVSVAIDYLLKRRKKDGTQPDTTHSTNKREVWLDITKNIAAFNIVVIHAVGSGYSGTFGTPQWTGFLLLNTLPRFAVPVFIMASGAQMLGRDIPIKKALKKAVRAALQLLVWNLIYMLLRCILWGNIFTITEVLTIPIKSQFSGHLWYFYFLVWLYLFSPIISAMYRSLSVKYRWYFVLITTVLPMVLVLYQQVLDLEGANIVPATFLYMTFPYAGMMVLGRLLYERSPHVQHRRFWPLLIAVVGFGGMLLLTVCYSQTHGKQTELFIAETRVFPVLFGAGVFSLASCSKESMERSSARLQSITTFLSQRLLGIYAFHCVIQWALPKFTLFGITFTRAEAAWKTLVVSLIYYSISVYCVAMMSKIPLLRKAVT